MSHDPIIDKVAEMAYESYRQRGAVDLDGKAIVEPPWATLPAALQASTRLRVKRIIDAYETVKADHARETHGGRVEARRS